MHAKMKSLALDIALSLSIIVSARAILGGVPAAGADPGTPALPGRLVALVDVTASSRGDPGHGSRAAHHVLCRLH